MPTSQDDRFGRYVLEKRIGRGGMAEVFTARYRAAAGVTKRVVLKKILPHKNDDPEFVKMFISEAKLTASLSHGNLVQVFDFGQLDGSYFLAMEYVEGVTLGKLIQRAEAQGLFALPAPYAVSIIMEACKGLHYAHTRQDEKGKPQNIVHRDVTPENILLSYEGEVKVADFGVAKSEEEGRQQTEAGVVKGKLMYLSPEQARGEQVDARTDVFALGVCLFRMLCGSHPFSGSDLNVMQQIAFGGGDSPSELNPELDPDLETVLLKAMARERDERYPSAQALHQGLSDWRNRYAPNHPSDGIAHLVNWLYERELRELSRPVQVPNTFLELVPIWQQVKLHQSGSRGRAATRPLRSPSKGQAAAQKRSPTGEAPRAKSQPRAAAVEGARARSQPLTQAVEAQPDPRRRAVWLAVGAAAIVAVSGVVALLLIQGQSVMVTARFETDPSGATVVIDGFTVEGVTPLQAQLTSGVAHQISINRDGYKPWAVVVNGEPGEERTVVAALTKLPKVAPVDQPVRVNHQVISNLSESDVDQPPVRFTFDRKRMAVDPRKERMQTFELPPGPWEFRGSGDVQILYEVPAPRDFPAPRKTGLQAKVVTRRLLYALFDAKPNSPVRVGFLESNDRKPLPSVTLNGPARLKLFTLMEEEASVRRLGFRVATNKPGSTTEALGATLETFSVPFARPVVREKRLRVRAMDPLLQYELSVRIPAGEEGNAAVICTFGRPASDESPKWAGREPVQLLTAPSTVRVAHTSSLWCTMLELGPGTAEKVEVSVMPL